MTSGQPNDLLKMSKYLDFMNIHPNNIDGLLKMGVPTAKIVMKLEFMGRGKLFPDQVHRTIAYNEACDLFANDKTWVKYYDSGVKANIAKKTNGVEISVIIYPSGRHVANEVKYAVKFGLAGVMAYTLNADDYHGICAGDSYSDTFIEFNMTSNVSQHIPIRNITNFPLLRTINDAIHVTIDEINQETNISKDSRYFFVM